MRDLREEMILEERIIDLAVGRERKQTDGDEAGRLEGDEFGDGHELLEPGQAAGRQVKLLDEDCFVHEAVPVDAGFHVAFPFVEVDVVVVTVVFMVYQ